MKVEITVDLNCKNCGELMEIFEELYAYNYGKFAKGYEYKCNNCFTKASVVWDEENYKK